MPKCGSQCWLCDLPIRYDTYSGCTHGCKYCFVQRKSDMQVKNGEGVQSLIRFIDGNRTKETNWCDWNIPIHIGGMSDPFQPCEAEQKRTLKVLKVLAERKYPVVISTKGILCIKEPWISLLKEMNCVMQISMLCDKYDSIEEGAPSFKKRCEMLRILSENVKRVIVRCQPYIHEIKDDMIENIPKFAEYGAYGVIFEGMKFMKKKSGLVRCGADWVQKKSILEADFEIFRKLCHENNMKFYSGENRLRTMGDSLTCCGIDGLDGFIPNTYNLNHIFNGDTTQPCKAQTTIGTATCFRALYQESEMGNFIKKQSFASMTDYLSENQKDYINSVMKGRTDDVQNKNENITLQDLQYR